MALSRNKLHINVINSDFHKISWIWSSYYKRLAFCFCFKHWPLLMSRRVISYLINNGSGGDLFPNDIDLFITFTNINQYSEARTKWSTFSMRFSTNTLRQNMIIAPKHCFNVISTLFLHCLFMWHFYEKLRAQINFTTHRQYSIWKKISENMPQIHIFKLIATSSMSELVNSWIQLVIRTRIMIIIYIYLQIGKLEACKPVCITFVSVSHFIQLLVKI